MQEASKVVNLPVNLSGIYPVGDRILVLPDDLKMTTDGGIAIPDSVLKEHFYAQNIGKLIAVGPDSWLHHIERGPGGNTEVGYRGPFAKVGDRVMFDRYGGEMKEGKDGRIYRILNDKDITAIVDDEIIYTDLKARLPFMQAQ